MTMPNFADLVAERLAANGLDFGLNRTWKTPPKKKIIREDCPCAFTLIGPTYQPISTDRGLYKVPRTYIQRILIMPFAGGATDINDGAESLARALEWIDIVQAYYQVHSLLHTATLEPLRYCKGIAAQTDTGPILTAAPGGELYTGINVSLNILMAANADYPAIPQSS